MGSVDVTAAATAAALDSTLAARIADADRGEGTAAPSAVDPTAQPPAASVDLIAAGRDAAFFFGSIVREGLPDRISAHWTDRRLERVGVALGHCAQRYEWLAKLLTGAGHPVGELLIALGDLGRPIAEPYVRALFQREEKPPARDDAAEPAASGKSRPNAVAPLEDQPAGG